MFPSLRFPHQDPIHPFSSHIHATCQAHRNKCIKIKNLCINLLKKAIIILGWRSTERKYRTVCPPMVISRSDLCRIRNISDQSCIENQNTHFVFRNFFLRIPCRLWEIVGKYCTGHRWQYSTAHTPCVLDTVGYKHRHWTRKLLFFYSNSGYVNA